MSVWLAMLIGAGIGIIITTLILSNTRNGRIKAEYEQYIAELELEHQQALAQAQKRSVNTSRAVLKGKWQNNLLRFYLSFNTYQVMPNFWVTRLITLFLMAIPILEMEMELPRISRLSCLILKVGSSFNQRTASNCSSNKRRKGTL